MTPEELTLLEDKANLINDGHVKVLKQDKGLIERVESSRIILTEDNKQVLMD